MLAIASLMIAAAACGSDSDVPGDALNGQWVVTSVELDSETADLPGDQIFIEISTPESSVRADTGCNRLFGSYSFFDDGAASFTVPGTSGNECSEQLASTEARLLLALHNVSHWAYDGPGRILVGPGVEVRLQPRL